MPVKKRARKASPKKPSTAKSSGMKLLAALKKKHKGELKTVIAKAFKQGLAQGLKKAKVAVKPKRKRAAKKKVK